MFVLTNHNVTVFFKRSRDVRDTRLWASEPLWISDTDPPACAMWAHALQHAEELRSWKPMLPRADVPHTIEEQHTQTHQQRVDTQRQRLTRISLPSTEQSSASASSASSDDSAASSHKRENAEDAQPEDHTSPAQQPATGREMEETVPLSELGLTGECLGAFQYGFTLKVSLRPPNASAPAMRILPP